jgi:UDP-perosamine 4-acetyltransferase
MRKKNKIIVLGGGGHARVLIDLIKTSGKYEIMGILDKKLKMGSSQMGIAVLGKDNLLPELYEKGCKNACIGVGSIKENGKREDLFLKVKKAGYSVPYLIHPCAFVSKETAIFEGVQIMAGAIVQAGCQIGENTLINTGAIIEHDCIIGKHVHICPGTVISGGCTIGDGVFIGAGATVMQGTKIGINAIIGLGSVVINEIKAGEKVKGVPAK